MIASSEAAACYSNHWLIASTEAVACYSNHWLIASFGKLYVTSARVLSAAILFFIFLLYVDPDPLGPYIFVTNLNSCLLRLGLGLEPNRPV